MPTFIQGALQGKTRQQVLTMIKTGEVYQYYATKRELEKILSKSLVCPKFVVRILLRKSDVHRTKAFKKRLENHNLANMIANWC